MSTPRSVLIIGIILLLWNLTGLSMLVRQYGMDLGELAKTDPVGARIFAEMPGWLWVVYAVAVGAGTIGAVLLLMKKAAAASLFLVSLIAVLVQFGYTLGATDLIAQKGFVMAAGFPIVVILIAIGQLLYARMLVAKRVLR